MADDAKQHILRSVYDPRAFTVEQHIALKHIVRAVVEDCKRRGIEHELAAAREAYRFSGPTHVMANMTDIESRLCERLHAELQYAKDYQRFMLVGAGGGSKA